MQYKYIKGGFLKMRKRKLLSVLIAGMVSLSVVLTGCGSKTEPAKEGTKTEAKMDADQTINLIGYDFKSLDPSVISDAESFTTLTNVYESLCKEVVKDGVTTLAPAGAESYDVSSDKMVYTFHLRKDAKWSDGKPVTAKDYVFSWKRLINPATGADYMTFLADMGVKGAKEIVDAADKKADAATLQGLVDKLGVEAKDDYTFVVTLAQPTAFFESALSFKCLVPQREDKFKELGDQYGVDPTKMVYNGPFVVSEYAKGSKIVYKKNDQYWDANNVKLQTAVGHIVNEPATITKMFEGKELDVAAATGDDLTKLKKEAEAGQFQYISGVDTSAYFNYFNVERPNLKSAKLRLALSLALNRQQYLDVVFKRNIVSNGLVPSGIAVSGKDYRKEVAEPLKDVKDDPKALFAEGLKEIGVSDASKLDLTLLLGPASTTTKAIADYLQKTYKDTFGFELKIKFSADSQAYFKDRQNGNFDICAGGWGADYNDVSTFFGVFLSNNPNNNGRYKSAEYDKLVNDAANESDAAKRVDLYKQAETLLIAKDAAITPTYYRDINTFEQNYVKGYYIPKFGGYYDLSTTYISGKE